MRTTPQDPWGKVVQNLRTFASWPPVDLFCSFVPFARLPQTRLKIGVLDQHLLSLSLLSPCDASSQWGSIVEKLSSTIDGNCDSLSSKQADTKLKE